MKYLNVLILILSGILITLVSAFFSIKGFVLFLPDKELFYGILGLGIAFELAKITISAFLFHRMKDQQFPILIKFIMSFCVISLITFSSIFTFVHLNANASKDISISNIQNTQVSRLLKENDIITQRINTIDLEINTISANDKPNTKLRIYNALTPEKEELKKELTANTDIINSLELNSITNNQYTILESISDFSGFTKENIFTYVILFIVIIIDPLAICLFLSGTYILSIPSTNTSKINKKIKRTSIFPPPNYIPNSTLPSYKPVSFFNTTHTAEVDTGEVHKDTINEDENINEEVILEDIHQNKEDSVFVSEVEIPYSVHTSYQESEPNKQLNTTVGKVNFKNVTDSIKKMNIK